ncbi:MAG: peptidylprolyl isomerase [Chitinophagales bacterium]
MQAAKNTVVAISYQLRTEPNGEVRDEATKEQPFQFLFGHQNVLDLFEKNLEGKVAGNQFQFVLTPENGYGERDEMAVIKLEKAAFVMDGQDASDMIQLGNIIPLQDQNGHPHQGRITEIGTNDVTIDMNHPFAGETLYFSGEVVEVRQAHETEIAHGHIHAHGDHSHH